MFTSSDNDRFASYGADGELFALVAEGLPEYPADLSTLSDEDLGSLHDAYIEEARAQMSAETPDPARVTELQDRIPALRTEAAARFAAVQTQLDELAALSDEDRQGVVDYVAALAANPVPVDMSGLGDLLDPPADPPTPLDGTGLVAGGQIDPALQAAAVAEGMATGMARGFAPVLDSLERLQTALAAQPVIHAEPRRVTAEDLAAYNTPEGQDGHRPSGTRPAARGRLVHTGDVPGVAIGHQFTEMDQLVAAFQRRHADIGVSTGTQDEKVLIASYQANEPNDVRDLRGLSTSVDGKELRRRINRVVGDKAIGVDPFNLGRELPIAKGGIAVEDPSSMVASGGLAAPVEPYYAQLLLAEADRPVLGAMPGFTAERGGIRLVLPPSLGTLTSATQPGLFTDGATDNSTTFTSATAAFTDADLNQPIVAPNGVTTIIPAGTIITAIGSGTSVTLSQASTGGNVTGVTFLLPSRNPNNLGGPVGLVTAAQDAIGSPSVKKYTYDVPLGTLAEFDVYSVYTSLQFANLTARTFPEQVEVNIRLANALAARVAEQAALDTITEWSTLLTFAKTFGTARQLLAQFDHLAAYYRNFNRMDPAMTLRLGIPAWAINAMRGDYISTFIGGGDNWGLSDDELNSWFADRHILPFFYWDGPSDISQLFPAVGSGAINTGVNNATPVAAPDYPGQGASTSFRTEVVSFMWAEGTWLGLTTGELNLGLVRDSILNSQNKFRNFEEIWETPAFVGLQSLRTVHKVASDGTYGAAASITLGVGSGL